jgi:hypothetical protein
MATMIERMMRAAKLDVDLYNEVERDTSLNQEALTVVILASVAGGIGSLIGGIIQGSIGIALLGLVVTVILEVVNYFIWAWITYFVGTNLFQGTADFGEMRRTLGYAYAPRILSILSFIPCVGPFIALAGGIWSLVAGVIAVREGLDFDTGKAVITVIIGWVVTLILTFIVGAVVGIGAAGVGGVLGTIQNRG